MVVTPIPISNHLIKILNLTVLGNTFEEYTYNSFIAKQTYTSFEICNIIEKYLCTSKQDCFNNLQNTVFE